MKAPNSSHSLRPLPFPDGYFDHVRCVDIAKGVPENCVSWFHTAFISRWPEAAVGFAIRGNFFDSGTLHHWCSPLIGVVQSHVHWCRSWSCGRKLVAREIKICLINRALAADIFFPYIPRVAPITASSETTLVSPVPMSMKFRKLQRHEHFLLEQRTFMAKGPTVLLIRFQYSSTFSNAGL